MIAKCSVCGSADNFFWTKAGDLEYFTVTDEFSFYKCNGCGCLLIDPVPEDRLSTIYPSNYYSFAPHDLSFIEKIKLALDQRFIRKMTNDIPKGSLNVLDIGGGSGWILDVARMADTRVQKTVEVDLDARAGEIARKNGHLFWHGRIEEFEPETTDRFDLVLALNLIEHLKDPAALLRKASTLLTPEGKLLVKTPNVDSLDARLFRKGYWGGLHSPRHWVLFTGSSITDLATRCGLEVESLSYTQGAPFWVHSILAWLYKKGMIHASAERPLFKHPLCAPLLASFAIFDFLRLPFSKGSQMNVVLKLPRTMLAKA